MNSLRVITFLGMVFSLSHLAFSQKTPESAVNVYCALDGEGAGYSSHQEHRKEFDSVQIDSVAAAWDESTIVKGYEIVRVIKKARSAKITVLDHILGTISSDFTLVPTTLDERVTLMLSVLVGNGRLTIRRSAPYHKDIYVENSFFRAG